MLRAKLDHFARSRYAQTRFQRTSLVINTAVDDAAVMPGLMPREAIFFFEDNDAGLWKCFRRLHGKRHADDAAADHCDVVRRVHCRWSVAGR